MPRGVEEVVEIVSVEVPVDPEVRLTVVGLSVAESPVAEGDICEESAALPEKPDILLKVMLDEVLEPTVVVKAIGLAPTTKSAS